MIARQVWRTAFKASCLPDDQDGKLYIPTDGRSRLIPPLPKLLRECDLKHCAARGSRGSNVEAANVSRGDNPRCVGAYGQLLPAVGAGLSGAPTSSDGSCFRGGYIKRSPKLLITSWTRLAIHDCDFGWGPGGITYEGLAFLLPSAINDGSLSLLISLQMKHMELFKRLFDEF